MQAGFEKILKLWKDLIHIGSQLYFLTVTQFDGLLVKPAKFLELNIIQTLQGRKPVRVLSHKGFSNHQSVDFIGIRLAYIVFAHGRSHDRVENTHFKILAD